MALAGYFDCAAGVSGDMVLGSLLDAGLRLRELRELLAGVPLKGYRIGASRVKRAGIAGTKVTVKTGSSSGRGLHCLDDVLEVIRKSRLPAAVSARAEEVFRQLAHAEAAVHGGRPAIAHFHELGAVDSLVDVIGSLAGLHLMEIGEVYASALPWSCGTVTCAHGTLPVPAPAAAELMKGIPVYGHPYRGELITPTGVAILRVCAKSIGPMPPLTVTRIGYGAGERRIPDFPNMLRLVIGERPGWAVPETVTVVEAETDDMTPAAYGYLMRRLYDAGALDVIVTPVLMKKGRPGHLLTMLCRRERTAELCRIVLAESTTLGLRFREENRMVIPRATFSVRTPHGRVRVKAARRPGGRVTVAPEYEDCAAVASRKGLPLLEVAEAASRAAGKAVAKKAVTRIFGKGSYKVHRLRTSRMLR